MNNLSSYCGLVDTKIRPSDKDLPVFYSHWLSGRLSYESAVIYKLKVLGFRICIESATLHIIYSTLSKSSVYLTGPEIWNFYAFEAFVVFICLSCRRTVLKV